MQGGGSLSELRLLPLTRSHSGILTFDFHDPPTCLPFPSQAAQPTSTLSQWGQVSPRAVMCPSTFEIKGYPRYSSAVSSVFPALTSWKQEDGCEFVASLDWLHIQFKASWVI